MLSAALSFFFFFFLHGCFSSPTTAGSGFSEEFRRFKCLLYAISPRGIVDFFSLLGVCEGVFALLFFGVCLSEAGTRLALLWCRPAVSIWCGCCSVLAGKDNGSSCGCVCCGGGSCVSELNSGKEALVLVLGVSGLLGVRVERDMGAMGVMGDASYSLSDWAVHEGVWKYSSLIPARLSCGDCVGV